MEAEAPLVVLLTGAGAGAGAGVEVAPLLFPSLLQLAQMQPPLRAQPQPHLAVLGQLLTQLLAPLLALLLM